MLSSWRTTTSAVQRSRCEPIQAIGQEAFRHSPFSMRREASTLSLTRYPRSKLVLASIFQVRLQTTRVPKVSLSWVTMVRLYQERELELMSSLRRLSELHFSLGWLAPRLTFALERLLLVVQEAQKFHFLPHCSVMPLSNCPLMQSELLTLPQRERPWGRSNQNLSSSASLKPLLSWVTEALKLAVLLVPLALTFAVKVLSWTKSSLMKEQGCFGQSDQGSTFTDCGFDISINSIKITQQDNSTPNHQILIQQNQIHHMTDTRKVHDIFEKTKGNKGATLSHTENLVGSALNEAANHLDAENKKLAASILVHKVQEISYEKDKSLILIVVTYRTNKVLLSSAYKKLITELEKRLKKTVLIISHRKIQSRWVKENRKLTRPNSRTLSAVYSAILDELLLPATIIGYRTRVRLDGTTFSRVALDKNEQHFLEDRVSAIRAAYKRLTTRQIEIEFQKEATFYNLKKGEKK